MPKDKPKDKPSDEPEPELQHCALCAMGSSQDPTRAHTLGTVEHP